MMGGTILCRRGLNTLVTAREGFDLKGLESPKLRVRAGVFRRSRAKQRGTRSSPGRKINSLGRHTASVQTKSLAHSLSRTFHQLCPNTRLSTHGIVAGSDSFHCSGSPLGTSDEPVDQAASENLPPLVHPSRLRTCPEQIRRLLEKKTWISCENFLTVQKKGQELPFTLD